MTRFSIDRMRFLLRANEECQTMKEIDPSHIHKNLYLIIQNVYVPYSSLPHFLGCT